jgi:hypothetical protein
MILLTQSHCAWYILPPYFFFVCVFYVCYIFIKCQDVLRSIILTLLQPLFAYDCYLLAPL